MFAASLIAEDILIGTGFGVAAILVGAALLFIYFVNRQKDRRKLIVASIYILAGVSCLAAIQINWRVAEVRSKPVIAACKQFHQKHQRYPEKLNELVPEFLPAIPHAGYTLISRRFFYSSSRPVLGFAVMFHGVASYDFQTNQWLTND
jgi:hypothetical protein